MFSVALNLILHRLYLFLTKSRTGLIRKHCQYHIPKAEREHSFYGNEFGIQLKNKLTQRGIAKECTDWVRRKPCFRSNYGKAPMQQFAAVQTMGAAALYIPLHGFSAVDLGYQHGDAVSNIVNKFDEPTHTGVFLNLFDQIWNEQENLEDVTSRICNHIDSEYQENSPEPTCFLMLYNIFSEFPEVLNEDDLPKDRSTYSVPAARHSGRHSIGSTRETTTWGHRRIAQLSQQRCLQRPWDAFIKRC